MENEPNAAEPTKAQTRAAVKYRSRNVSKWLLLIPIALMPGLAVIAIIILFGSIGSSPMLWAGVWGIAATPLGFVIALVLPVRGFFLVRRNKVLFAFSCVFLAACILFAIMLPKYLVSAYSYSNYFNSDEYRNYSNLRSEMSYAMLYEQAERGIERMDDGNRDAVAYIEEYCNELDELSGGSSETEIFEEYNTYFDSLESTSVSVNYYDYEERKMPLEGYGEEIYDGYVCTLDEPVVYEFERFTDASGIETDLIKERDRFDEIMYDISSAVSDFANDLYNAENELKKYGNTIKSSEDILPDLLAAAANVPRELLGGGLIVPPSPAPAYLSSAGTGICVYVILILNIVFAAGGRRLKRQVKTAAEHTDIVYGKTRRNEFKRTLSRLSGNRDAAAFYAAIAGAEAEYAAALPSLAFATKAQAKQGMDEIVMRCAVTEGVGAAKAMRGRLKTLWKARDHAALRELDRVYAEKFEAYRTKLIADAHVRGEDLEPEYDGKSKFDGLVLQQIGWRILCFIVKWGTLTLAKPLTDYWMHKWQCRHTVYDGKRLRFDGNGFQLFGRRMLWLLLTVCTLGIYALIAKFNVRKWFAKHTHVKGEYPQLGGTFDGKDIVLTLLKLACLVLKILTLFIIKPVADMWIYKWEVRHTVYDGRRLYFDGNVIQLFGKYMLWWLLSMVTLGVYSFFAANRLLKWRVKHTHLRDGYCCVF